MSKPFLTFEKATVRAGQKEILKDFSFGLRSNEQWAIIGPNGSGKSTFVKAIWGGAVLSRGEVTLHFADKARHHPASNKHLIGYVSFELHQNLLEQEELLDAIREYAGKEEEFTTGENVFFSGVNEEELCLKKQKAAEITELMQIKALLPKNINSLSTGEMRKILIARSLLKEPRLLILDEPFDGLDAASREKLKESIENLMASDLRVILIAHRLEEIVPSVSHVLMMKNGMIFKQGPKEEVLNSEYISELYEAPLKVKKGAVYEMHYEIEKQAKLEIGDLYKDFKKSESKFPLIEMKDVTVKYNDKITLNKLNWELSPKENWCILGQNGSGKSTIVRLITGENVQGYANNISLFGKRKGSNESLWEIKKRLGVVSGEVQVAYRKDMSAFDVVCSGFYDSIGLYKFPSLEEEKIAQKWIDLLEINELAQKNYAHLSYGQKRMILLARAMVKTPQLLIVDEPCHGLDIKNRAKILQIIEKIGETPTQLLYITHHEEEILPCITHILQLEKGETLAKGPI